MEIDLVRQGGPEPTEEEKAIARRVLFGYIDGLGEVNKKRWRRFINGLMKLVPGEISKIKAVRPRVGKTHAKHMKMEQTIFEAQETFGRFEDFRDWLKVGAGHCDFVTNVHGVQVARPKSISYEAIEDEGEMQEVHDNMVGFLRTQHAAHVLWPALPEVQRHAAIESILQEFRE